MTKKKFKREVHEPTMQIVEVDLFINRPVTIYRIHNRL